jgi:hypothetical protein
MRSQCRRTFKMGFLIALAISSAAVQSGFAKGAGHVHSKSAVRPSQPNAKVVPRSENNTQVPAKTNAIRGVDKPPQIDTRISVQPPHFGKSLNRVNPLPIVRNPYHPRTLSALPRASKPPVRNAIGISILPRENVGTRNGVHPNGLRASPVSPAIPRSSTGLAGASGIKERGPHLPTYVASPGASRGVISGTGLAARHLGPPQIGGPKAVAGINGTTIKAPH